MHGSVNFFLRDYTIASFCGAYELHQATYVLQVIRVFFSSSPSNVFIHGATLEVRHWRFFHASWSQMWFPYQAGQCATDTCLLSARHHKSSALKRNNELRDVSATRAVFNLSFYHPIPNFSETSFYWQNST